MIDIVLASSSPRRRELLKQIGVIPAIIKPDTDETRLSKESVGDFLKRVTIEKGQSVIGDNLKNSLVISSDTIVLQGNNVMGKPVNREDAKNILRNLSGSSHQVKTGVAISYKGETWYDCETTEVEFCKIPEAELEFYLNNEHYSDKAGAYAIQGLASLFIRRIDGCYFNVMGFPLNMFARLLQSAGLWEEVYFRK